MNVQSRGFEPGGVEELVLPAGVTGGDTGHARMLESHFLFFLVHSSEHVLHVHPHPFFYDARFQPMRSRDLPDKKKKQ